MSLINWYRSNFATWKKFQRFPASLQVSGRWPSETYMKYPATTSFKGQKVLNFGCGKTTYADPNVVNLDVVAGPGIDVVCTENKLPFSDETFDFVLANHVLEHVPNWFESFKELARVLKHGGTLEVWIPPISSDSAFSYRDHLNRIGLLSFSGCYSFSNAGHNVLAERDFQEAGAVRDLEIIQYGKRAIVKWWTMLAWPSLLDWMTTYLRNVVSEEKYVFRKR